MARVQDRLQDGSHRAAGPAGAITEALAAAAAGKPGLFVAFDRAADHFGDALVTSVAPRNLAHQVRFRLGGEGRVCDYFLLAGPWREHLVEIARQPVFAEVAEIAAHGRMPKESRHYRRFRQRLESGNPMVRNRIVLDSAPMIESYFSYVGELVENIRKRGVEPRSKTNVEDIASLATSPVRPLAGEVIERDIGVGLGANGELFRVCAGAHRMAAAIVLGLASVPVELRLIHVEFLAKVMAQSGCGPLDAVPHCVRFVADTYRNQP